MMGIRITLNQKAIAKLGDAILKSADLTMESLKTDVFSEEVMLALCKIRTLLLTHIKTEIRYVLH